MNFKCAGFMKRDQEIQELRDEITYLKAVQKTIIKENDELRERLRQLCPEIIFQPPVN